MGRITRAYREAAERDRQAVAEALKARGCPQCGLTFGSAAAYTVHRDGRCLPPGAYGQLVEVSGVWCLRGSDASRR